MQPHMAFPLHDSSQVGEVRRFAVRLSVELGLQEEEVGRVGLVVTEAAANIVKHAQSGTVLVGEVPAALGGPGVEVFAIDQGPGMSDVDRCMVDGYSTAGSPGTGLGAISRMSSQFQIYAPPGVGTALYLRVLTKGHRPQSGGMVSLACVSLAAPGESVSGDAWAAAQGLERTVILVADGLGHGPLAARAAEEAAQVVGEASHLPPDQLLERAHGRLLATRGAAAFVTEISAAKMELRYAGLGNVSAVLANRAEAHSLLSQNGTLGAHFRPIRVNASPWTAESVLIMHSDGVTTRWSLANYPGLIHKDPALIAVVLLRDHIRGKDDATVLVAKAAGRTP